MTVWKWGVELPEATDLPGLPKGIVLHWTGGGPKANRIDLGAYHYVVETDGTVREGLHPVAANMRQLSSGDEYAQHTGGFNSFRVGLSAAGMRGYTSRHRTGEVPLTSLQIDRLCELAAYFCTFAGLDPMNPAHLCTHQEVWTIHGVKGTRNDQKTDIEFLPFLRHLEEDEVGPFLREQVAATIELDVALDARPPKVEVARHGVDPPHLEPVTTPERPQLAAASEAQPSLWRRVTRAARRIPMVAASPVVQAKAWYESLTIWFNVLATLFAAVLPLLEAVQNPGPIIVAVITIGNLILRWKTKRPVATTKGQLKAVG